MTILWLLVWVSSDVPAIAVAGDLTTWGCWLLAAVIFDLLMK